MAGTRQEPTGASSGSKSRSWVYVPLAIFLAVAAMFAFALTTGDPSKLPSALIGRPVPAVAFAPLEGLTGPSGPVAGFSATDLAKGEVSIVNFWASWCAPCVEEHPLLVDLAATSGVKIYGVNYKDKAEAARRFLGRYGNPFSAMGVDPQGRGAIEWGVYGMPETFVVNGRGEIAYKHVGPMTRASVETQILPALKAAVEATKPVAAR
jgi:cytochrome c biogenesis protein CcmG/thiol:disulfide interchange protein DsbE